jgi:hypothetical protein
MVPVHGRPAAGQAQRPALDDERRLITCPVRSPRKNSGTFALGGLTRRAAVRSRGVASGWGIVSEATDAA